jgi:serine phosphatase RsbU (regulator of sigma subunit)
VGRGDASGLLVLHLSPNLAFDEGYRGFAELVGGTVGAALGSAHRRARELDEQRRISEAFQSALLAPASDLPTVAARYQSASGELYVGGDWYDVIRLAEGRRALVVGDCVGKGLVAATVMGQLRSAVRAHLLTGLGPARVLEAMDRFAATVDGALCTTVVCVVVDSGVGRATYASAGHLAPLLVRRDGPAEWLDDARGLPLAVAEDPREEATVSTVPGDLLVLYTDGLVERRGVSIDERLDQLATVASELAGGTVQAIADGLLAEMDTATAPDDVALVVKRVPRNPE